MSSRLTKCSAAMAAAAACALTLAACAPQGNAGAAQPDGMKFVDYAGVTKEYTAAQTHYHLPTGEAWPDMSVLRLDPNGSYEKGFGETKTVYVWNCAWAKAYLKESDKGSPAALEALKNYESVEQTDTFIKYWDPQSVQAAFRAGVESAKLGDFSAIQKDVAANCPGGDPRL